MHASQGLTAESSLRTPALALNAQSRKKLTLTHVDAGAQYIDEYSQLKAELNNAAAVRTADARKTKYQLDVNVYHKPHERYGRVAMLTYSGDHLQLPPVPASSSMLAPIAEATNEHVAGARIFRNGLPV